MKGCVQWNQFRVDKISPRAGLELDNSRSVDGLIGLRKGCRHRSDCS